MSETITFTATASFGNSTETSVLTVTSHAVNEAYFAEEVKDASDNKTYNKITETLKISEEVFIVVKGVDLDGKKANVIILDENNVINTKQVNGINVVPVLVNDNEKTTVEITIDKTDNNINYGIIKIKLRPKSNSDLQTFTTNIKNAPNQKAKLYLSVDLHTLNDDIDATDIDYNGTENENDTTLTNIWGNQDEDFLKVQSCFCDRDFSREEVIELIYHLRDEFNYVTHREKFFDLGTDHFINNRTSNLADNNDKIDTFKDELNTMFSNFNINRCKRKIHFLAQIYIETRHFRSTHEASGVCSGYKGGCDFRGRGMKQITHDYNYLAYYDYVKNKNYSDTYDNLRGSANNVPVSDYLDQLDSVTNQKITTDFYNNTLKPFIKDLSENLYEAFDSAGWF